jgi:hypothetical protein
MAYGLDTDAFIENGPAVQAIRAQSINSTARTWRALNPERRLALVEKALNPANDPVAAYRVAV